MFKEKLNISSIYFSKDWQPKEGLKSHPDAGRDIHGRVVSYEPSTPIKYKSLFGKKKLRITLKKLYETVTYKINPSEAIWQGKTFYQGEGWQPKSGIVKPGIYTKSQPIIRPSGSLKIPGAYETKFFVVDFSSVVDRWFGVLVIKKPKFKLFQKNKKQFTARDVVKPEPKGKGGTITIQKLKTPKTKVIYEPPEVDMIKEFVYEPPDTDMLYDFDNSIRWDVEPVYDRMPDFKQKPYSVGVQRVKPKLKFYPIVSTFQNVKQKQKSVSIYDSFIDTVNIQKQNIENISLQKQSSDMRYDYKMDYDFLNVNMYKPPIQPSVKPPIQPSVKPPKDPKKYYFDLPEGKSTKKKKKKTMDGYGLGYRYRSWKVPTMKDILGVR